MRLELKIWFGLLMLVVLAFFTYVGFEPMIESIVRRESIKTILGCLPAFIYCVVAYWLLWRYTSDILSGRPVRWRAFHDRLVLFALAFSFVAVVPSLIATIVLTIMTIFGANLGTGALIAATFFVASGAILFIRIFEICTVKRLTKMSSGNQPTEKIPEPTE